MAALPAQPQAFAFWRLAGIVGLVGALSLACFSPRFVYWRLLTVNLPVTTSEVIRAQAALKQLADPSLKFSDHTNRVLNWRLLFPVLGHVLHVPPKVYLALPHVGAVGVLMLVAWLAIRQSPDVRLTAALTSLAATCSWFFVSTGWLGYFDSWLMLGLLAFLFLPGWGMIAALLATPWIDERFVLVLPLLGATRCILQPSFARSIQAISGPRITVMIVAGVAPWIAVRAGSTIIAHDETTLGYLTGLSARQMAIEPWIYLQGVWHGLRFFWVPILAWLALEWRSCLSRASGLTLLFVGTLAINLFIAEDTSRSMSVFVPVATAATLMWWKRQPLAAVPVSIAAAALNFLTPAHHVSGNGTWPIRFVHAELADCRTPPLGMTAGHHFQRASAFIRQEQFSEALEALAITLQLDPAHDEAHHVTALLLTKAGKFREALSHASSAVRLQPDNLNYCNNLACIRYYVGDVEGATAGFELILKKSQPGDPFHESARASLEDLRRALPSAR
ncbi:MAG: hypothetical protein JNL39_02295 [Opitutaceae bacterium]|nr:hypothetical protein [Opitutaceae bacterium]